MAGVKGKAAISTEEALAAATAETLIQLVAASNHRVLIKGWSVSFDGTSVTAEPARIRLLRQTTAGTGSSLTLVKWDSTIDETLQTTAQQDFSAEPTASDVLEVKNCHPQQGYEKLYPLGEELIVPGGTRLGLEVTAPAVVNCVAEIYFEE